LEIINPFSGPEHRPFVLEGGKNAALLVHGFPGTPAEMRPLGEALQAASWTVQGLLLPGFGSQYSELQEKKMEDWLDAIEVALDSLYREHHRIMLIGYSMGGGLSIHAAARQPVDGLVLLAPFWQTRGWFWSLMPVIKHLFPRIKPFRVFKLNLDEPAIRAGIGSFIQGIDLDDPQVRWEVNNFEFPTAIVDELRRVGQVAARSASQVKAPVLVVQGLRDRWVSPSASRRLLQILPGPLCYREVPAEHDLLNIEKPAWLAVRKAVIDFAASIYSQP
jgi:carboxylesterase